MPLSLCCPVVPAASCRTLPHTCVSRHDGAGAMSACQLARALSRTSAACGAAWVTRTSQIWVCLSKAEQSAQAWEQSSAILCAAPCAGSKSEGGYDYVARFTTPWMGINEDPVTGAGPYLHARPQCIHMKPVVRLCLHACWARMLASGKSAGTADAIHNRGPGPSMLTLSMQALSIRCSAPITAAAGTPTSAS